MKAISAYFVKAPKEHCNSSSQDNCLVAAKLRPPAKRKPTSTLQRRQLFSSENGKFHTKTNQYSYSKRHQYEVHKNRVCTHVCVDIYQLLIKRSFVYSPLPSPG